MATYFHEVRSVSLKSFVVCILFFIAIPYFLNLYAKEGRACCQQSHCDFGYTCIAIPDGCDLVNKYGSCTQSIIECPNGYGCPAGMYCMDYVCVGFGPGTPTPGGGSYEYQRCPDGQALSCGTVAEAGSPPRQPSLPETGLAQINFLLYS